ncbi:MAG TPA: hypothetical protein VKY26_06425 [Actinomycetota bacterium]|nr:hypothetical protein [Actinomycetota bacterium]
MDREFGADVPALEESGERLATAIDPRLAEVWACVFAADFDPDELAQQVGWFLRMAYLRGYHDGLCEPEAGSLYTELGIQVPPRRRRAAAIRHGSSGRREES